jgi:hypothetical protein
MRKKQLEEQISRMAAILGRRGGLAPHSNARGFAAMSPEEHAEATRKGIAARREKKLKKVLDNHERP